MKRLYLLVPDIDNATRIVNALKEMGIMNEGMHVIVRDTENQRRLEMTQVLEAGLLETTDIKYALIRGIIAGGLLGLIAGTLLVLFPPQEFIVFALGVGTVVLITLLGVLFGAWASTLIGVSIPNPAVQKFERAVEAGGIMMIVDIPNVEENQIRHFMQTYHPETKIYGSNRTRSNDDTNGSTKDQTHTFNNGNG